MTTPIIQAYDGLNQEIIAAGPATHSPGTAEWFTVETDGETVDLRTYGVVHCIEEDEHTITVCGWQPDPDVTDSTLDEMQAELREFYRDPPAATAETDDDPETGGRVYYFELGSDSDTSFFGHFTQVVPKQNDALVVEGEPFEAFEPRTGIDDEGLYTLVSASSVEPDDDPRGVVEARRNLDGQRSKAGTDWN